MSADHREQPQPCANGCLWCGEPVKEAEIVAHRTCATEELASNREGYAAEWKAKREVERLARAHDDVADVADRLWELLLDACGRSAATVECVIEAADCAGGQCEGDHDDEGQPIAVYCLLHRLNREGEHAPRELTI